MLSDILRLIVVFDLHHFSKNIQSIPFLTLMQFWRLDNIADIKKWEFWLKSSLFHLHLKSFEFVGCKYLLLKGRLFWCPVFGVWSSSSPQRDWVDGYSYLMPSHFSVYFLEIVSYRLINQLYLRDGRGGRWRLGGFYFFLLLLFNFHLEIPSFFPL